MCERSTEKTFDIHPAVIICNIHPMREKMILYVSFFQKQQIPYLLQEVIIRVVKAVLENVSMVSNTEKYPSNNNL